MNEETKFSKIKNTQMRNKIISGTVGLMLVSSLYISSTGKDEIKQSEGFSQIEYKDTASVPTICWGAANTGLKVASLDQCELLLDRHIDEVDKMLKKYVKHPLTQDQYDVLHDFGHQYKYKFTTSTLLKKINQGDCMGAANQFLRWRLVNGKYSQGVFNRSKKNSIKFKKDCHLWTSFSDIS